MAQLRASQNQLSSTIAAASRGGSRRSCDGMIGIAHDPRFYLFLGRVRDGERKERRKRREERRGIGRRDLSPRFLFVRCIARVLCTFSPLPARERRVLRSFNGDRI